MSLSILNLVFLFIFSILIVFLAKQLITNFFDKQRSNKTIKLDNNKLRRNIIANINNLYCLEQAFFFKKNNINCCC